MSTMYSPSRTNKTPWMQDLTLIKQIKTSDTSGYESITETTRTIACTFSEGISRTEFYEGMKAGIQLSATAEIWQDDYEKEELCSYEESRYRIVRVFETGRGTLELSLSEVIR